MSKRAIRIIGVIVVVALLIVGGALFVRVRAARAASATPPVTVSVTQGRIEETVGASGTVAASQEANLAFGTSGTVAAVPVTPGEQVKAGQQLAQLDTSPLQLQVESAQAGLDAAQAHLVQAQQPATADDIAAAQAALASAQANYAQVKAGPTADSLAAAKAALDNAQAALQQAQSAYDQVKDRPNIGMLPQSLNLEQATNNYQEALANYDAAKNHPTASELAAAKSQVAQAQYQLSLLQAQPSPQDVAVYQAQLKQAQVALSQAQAQLSSASISAPFDGTVLAVNVQPGDAAGPGSPAIVLASSAAAVVDANVDEVDVASIATGQLVHLTLSSFPGATIDGKVASVAPTSTSVGGAVAYQVVVAFMPGDLPVRLGMTANVAFVVASADNALLVPNRVLTVDRQANRYYVIRQLADGTTQQVQVRIGLHNDSQTQIVSGVNAGDKLVVPQVAGTTSSSSSQSTSNFRGPFGGLGGGTIRQGGSSGSNSGSSGSNSGGRTGGGVTP